MIPLTAAEVFSQFLTSLKVLTCGTARACSFARGKTGVAVIISCPVCQSQSVRRSRRRRVVERTLLSAICFRPFRCMDCSARFFRWSLHSRVPAGHPRTIDSQSQTGNDKRQPLGREATRLNLNPSN
jgi:predicted Zn-ribbon and HTH transcriptional regulator